MTSAEAWALVAMPWVIWGIAFLCQRIDSEIAYASRVEVHDG